MFVGFAPAACEFRRFVARHQRPYTATESCTKCRCRERPKRARLFCQRYRFGDLVAQKLVCRSLRIIDQLAESSEVPACKCIAGLRDNDFRLQPELFEAIGQPFGISTAASLSKRGTQAA